MLRGLVFSRIRQHWLPSYNNHNFCTSTFQYGELLLSVDKKKRKKLFELQVECSLTTHTGVISHESIHGKAPGHVSVSDMGAKLIIRRPTLEEYVLLMKRVATPAYPKDIWTMLGLLDIGPGSVVLEAGSGSGALTLHLSRAVGSSGCVHSFEINEHHLNLARKNYRSWVASLEKAYRKVPWSVNVHFYHSDVKCAQDLIQTPLDGAALDLVQPQDALATLGDLLKPCAPVVLYLPNLSQVMQVDAHLRSRRIPLRLERVTEVTCKQWTVSPAQIKHAHGITSKQDSQPLDKEGSSEAEQGQLFSNSVNNWNYIARPSHYQEPHSAFLMKLTKFCSSQ